MPAPYTSGNGNATVMMRCYYNGKMEESWNRDLWKPEGKPSGEQPGS